MNLVSKINWKGLLHSVRERDSMLTPQVHIWCSCHPASHTTLHFLEKDLTIFFSQVSSGHTVCWLGETKQWAILPYFVFLQFQFLMGFYNYGWQTLLPLWFHGPFLTPYEFLGNRNYDLLDFFPLYSSLMSGTYSIHHKHLVKWAWFYKTLSTLFKCLKLLNLGQGLSLTVKGKA